MLSCWRMLSHYMSMAAFILFAVCECVIFFLSIEKHKTFVITYHHQTAQEQFYLTVCIYKMHIGKQKNNKRRNITYVKIFCNFIYIRIDLNAMAEYYGIDSVIHLDAKSLLRSKLK